MKLSLTDFRVYKSLDFEGDIVPVVPTHPRNAINTNPVASAPAANAGTQPGEGSDTFFPSEVKFSNDIADNKVLWGGQPYSNIQNFIQDDPTAFEAAANQLARTADFRDWATSAVEEGVSIGQLLNGATTTPFGAKGLVLAANLSEELTSGGVLGTAGAGIVAGALVLGGLNEVVDGLTAGNVIGSLEANLSVHLHDFIKHGG